LDGSGKSLLMRWVDAVVEVRNQAGKESCSDLVSGHHLADRSAAAR